MKVPPNSRVETKWTESGKPQMAIVRLTDIERERALAASIQLQILPDYEVHPSRAEQVALDVATTQIPDVIRLVKLLREQGFPLITVLGFPKPDPAIVTPANGKVYQAAVKPQIALLTSVLGAACGLGGFAFRTENDGRLLRAVAPTKQEAGKASSQGFDNDLCMHQDNCNQWMIHEAAFARGRPFMNPEQAFVAIRTRKDVPMEVASCDAILLELEKKYGSDVIGDLSAPDFGALWPDSHNRGGTLAVSHVPVLVRDSLGHIHSRYHATNIVGLTAKAQLALERLHEVVIATKSVIEIYSDPGDLIIYSNTRMMHRRRSFTPSFNGKDRFYIRVYFAPIHILTDSRVID